MNYDWYTDKVTPSRIVFTLSSISVIIVRQLIHFVPGLADIKGSVGWSLPCHIPPALTRGQAGTEQQPQPQPHSKTTWSSIASVEFATHYSDIIMGVIVSQITSLTIVTQLFMQTQIKENIKAPRHWPLCREFTRDWWIPHTNGQYCRKYFQLMMPSWISGLLGYSSLPRTEMVPPNSFCWEVSILLILPLLIAID